MNLGTTNASLLPLAFGFGSWAMLWFATAAAAPILIHLWNRRRYREVTWAAMEYLLAAIRKNTRRIRIEQLILLLIRTAILLLLALAVAEPFLESIGAVNMASRRTHRLIVLDASYSMAYKPSDKTRFQRAKELISQIVEESTLGDGFTLVLLADPPRIVVGTPVYDRRDFLEEVQNVRLIHGGAELSQTLARVDEVLKTVRKEHPKLYSHQVFFLTDLGRNTWAPDLKSDAAGAEFRKRAKALSDLAALSVIDLGQTGSDNLAVTGLRTSEPFAVAGRSMTIEAELRAFGQGKSQQLVELYVDGKRSGESYVDLADNGSSSVVFQQDFENAGEHEVEVRLPTDTLEIDNRRFLALRVRAFLKVLCINGQSSPNGRQATDYLVSALVHQKDPSAALVQAHVAPETALTERELAQYDAIFLCNVGQFSRGEAQQLRNYVQRGGGLAVFLGDHVQVESYNERLGPDGSLPPLLPARLGEIVTLPPASSAYVFDPLGYGHEIIAPFKGNERVKFLNTPVSKYVRLEVPKEAPQVPGVSKKDAAGQEPSAQELPRIALAFTSGDPVIVEQKYGRGRVLLVATAAGDDPNKQAPWTLMQVHGNFVVLAHGMLATAVAGQFQQRNLLVGEAISGTLALSDVDGRVKVRTPWNTEEQSLIKAEGDQGAWDFAGTDESGLYDVQLPANAIAPNVKYAINVDTRESDLARIEPEELQDEWWKGVPLAVRTNWQNLEDRPAAPIAQRGYLHWWLLCVVAALLLLETFLAWLFGRHA